MEKQSSTRLYCLLARKAPVGVIFRRGPSNAVQLLTWNLITDEITEGQWFKGRIYERRCDLSPNGEYLIYFAAKHKPPYGTWTAVSRPPYFTALALWPKGDCWGGGGLFDASEKGITLNHSSCHMSLASDFRLPQNFKVRPHGEYSGGGEDNPIMSDRLKRDGWKEIQEGKYKENNYGSEKLWFEYTEPQVWEKSSSNGKSKIHFELNGIKESDGPWYVHSLKHYIGDQCVDVGKCDWADINENGVVHYSLNGELRKRLLDGSDSIIVDLSENKFSPIPASPEAQNW